MPATTDMRKSTQHRVHALICAPCLDRITGPQHAGETRLGHEAALQPYVEAICRIERRRNKTFPLERTELLLRNSKTDWRDFGGRIDCIESRVSGRGVCNLSYVGGRAVQRMRRRSEPIPTFYFHHQLVHYALQDNIATILSWSSSSYVHVLMFHPV